MLAAEETARAALGAPVLLVLLVLRMLGLLVWSTLVLAPAMTTTSARTMHAFQVNAFINRERAVRPAERVRAATPRGCACAASTRLRVLSKTRGAPRPLRSVSARDWPQPAGAAPRTLTATTATNARRRRAPVPNA